MAEYIFNKLNYLKHRLNSCPVVLFLDFDLTLSPLAKNPNDAFLPKNTKNNLRKIASLVSVVIITGRKLSDIKKRVNIKGIYYVGNHGLEHNLNKKYEISEEISSVAREALLRVKKELIKIRKKYPKIVFEDKKYSLALGYRLIKLNEVRAIETLFRNIQNEIRKEDILETRLDKKTFEIRARTKVNKGTACLLILKNLQNRYHKKFLSIYIGDSETDEDAFSVLQKSGITIRVGTNNKSSAKWYLHNTKEVNLFLEWFLSFKK